MTSPLSVVRSSASEPMAEFLGSGLRLLLKFQSAGKCVKLDANTVLEAPRAANGDESRTGSGSTELGYFRRKMSQGTDWTLQLRSSLLRVTIVLFSHLKNKNLLETISISI